MKLFLILAAAFSVTLGAAIFAGTQVINAVERPTSTSTLSIQVGDQTRSYEVILPAKPLPKSAPIIMMLSGKAASTSQEINRDQYLPYADADMAELVYPVAIHESWNVGSKCCGWAGLHNVSDVAFIKDLIPKIDPGHERPLYLVGYSNGGRLAYEFACDDPGLFDAIAVAKADPMPGCVVSTPQTIIDIASLDDTWVPYKPGEKGQESPAATVQFARLKAADGCDSTTEVTKLGNMTDTTWTQCANDTRLSFAVWTTGAHNFPRPPADYPTAAAVTWSFFNQTALEPLPKTK